MALRSRLRFPSIRRPLLLKSTSATSRPSTRSFACLLIPLDRGCRRFSESERTHALLETSIGERARLLNESQRRLVDAVAQAGGRRPVVQDVAQVRIAS